MWKECEMKLRHFCSNIFFFQFSWQTEMDSMIRFRITFKYLSITQDLRSTIWAHKTPSSSFIFLCLKILLQSSSSSTVNNSFSSSQAAMVQLKISSLYKYWSEGWKLCQRLTRSFQFWISKSLCIKWSNTEKLKHHELLMHVGCRCIRLPDGGPHVQPRDHRQAHLRQPEPGGLGWLRAETSVI